MAAVIVANSGGVLFQIECLPRGGTGDEIEGLRLKCAERPGDWTTGDFWPDSMPLTKSCRVTSRGPETSC